MMQILDAEGVKPITDNLRRPDEDNTKGYYEHEAVKFLAKGEHQFLEHAQGKAVKVVSTLLKNLPKDNSYKVIFMHRDLDEILASQKKMLINRKSSAEQDDELARMYTKHLKSVSIWLSKQKNFQVIEINYADILSDPEAQINTLTESLGISMNRQRMIQVIDSSMNHHKRSVPDGSTANC